MTISADVQFLTLVLICCCQYCS